MTVQDFFNQVIGVMSEMKQNSSAYTEFILPMTNQIMAEALSVENSQRLALGLEELPTAPVMKTLADEIPYQDGVIQNVLCWGVAALLALGDDENVRAGYYDSKYQTNRLLFARANYVPMEQVY